MNKGSMEGCFGSRVKNTAYKLLRHGLVSVIATDAHGTEMRSPRINEARRITESLVTKEYANILFCENPKRICANSATFRFKAIPFA